MQFQVQGIDHVVLQVDEPELVAAKLEKSLGFRLERINEKAGVWHLRAGSSLVDLVLPGRSGAFGGGMRVEHVALACQGKWDEAAREHLVGEGFVVDSPRRRFGAAGERESVYARDPAGNTWELIFQEREVTW